MPAPSPGKGCPSRKSRERFLLGIFQQSHSVFLAAEYAVKQLRYLGLPHPSHTRQGRKRQGSPTSGTPTSLPFSHFWPDKTPSQVPTSSDCSLELVTGSGFPDRAPLPGSHSPAASDLLLNH